MCEVLAGDVAVLAGQVVPVVPQEQFLEGGWGTGERRDAEVEQLAQHRVHPGRVDLAAHPQAVDLQVVHPGDRFEPGHRAHGVGVDPGPVCGEV